MSVKYKDQLIAGAPGKDATINGQNTLEIVAGENVTIEQKDSVLTINATGGGTGGGTSGGTSGELGGEVYSTEETIIGTWTDGKPLYRKVFTVTTGAATGQNQVTTDSPLSGCSPIFFSGFFTDSDGNVLPVNFSNNEGQNFSAFVYGGNIYTNVSGSAFLNRPVKLCIEYTKAADQGGNVSEEEVYSTEETRVGTWIDGTALYRRVFEITTGAGRGQNQITTDYPLSGCFPIFFSGYFIDQYGSVLPIGYKAVDGAHFSAFVASGNIYTNVNGSAFLNRPVKLCIEYTKG